MVSLVMSASGLVPGLPGTHMNPPRMLQKPRVDVFLPFGRRIPVLLGAALVP